MGTFDSNIWQYIIIGWGIDLVQQKNDKSTPVMIHFTDAYMCHPASMI